MKVVVFKYGFHLKKVKNAACIDIKTLKKFEQLHIHFIKRTKYNIVYSMMYIIIKSLNFSKIEYFANFEYVGANEKLFYKKVKRLNRKSKLQIFQ